MAKTLPRILLALLLSIISLAVSCARAAEQADLLLVLAADVSRSVDRAKFEQVRDERGRNVEALRRFRDLAALRYKEGATLYLEVSAAEQSLFNAELDYVTSQALYFQSYANLYKAMGGGWVNEAEQLVPGGVASDSIRPTNVGASQESVTTHE